MALRFRYSQLGDVCKSASFPQATVLKNVVSLYMQGEDLEVTSHHPHCTAIANTSSNSLVLAAYRQQVHTLGRARPLACRITIGIRRPAHSLLFLLQTSCKAVRTARAATLGAV